MENDELINKENENKIEKDQNSENLIEPDQIIPEETDVENDPDKIAENLLESEQTFSEDPVVEDEASLETTIDEPSDPVTPFEKEVVKKMPGWLSKSLIYGGVGILLLLAGFLIAFFTTTVPAQNSYQTVQQELKNKETALNDLQTQFDQNNNDLTEAKSDLVSLQQDFQSLEQDFQSLEQDNQLILSNSEFNQNLIDLKYEISRAKFAMLNEDLISANLALSLATDKFEIIQSMLDPEISNGMKEKLQEIQNLVRTDPDNALDQLRTLNENLERIPLK